MRRLFFILLGIMLLVSGCMPAAQQPEQVTPFYKQLAEGDMSNEVKEWAEEHKEDPGTHVKSFGNKTYLLVTWGEKPTGGYTIVTENVFAAKSGETIIAVFRLKEPNQEAVSQAITYPRVVVEIERTTKEIEFVFVGKQLPEKEEAKEEQRTENIIVETPVAGAVISSPVIVSGRARVPEGTLIIVIEDGHNELAREVVTATTGGPEWGEFSAEIEFSNPTSPSGTVIVYYESLKDGSIAEQVMVPVKFQND